MSDTSSMFFKPSNKQFYSFRIDETVYEITALSFQNIMKGIKEGGILKVAEDGSPYIVNRPPVKISLEEILSNQLHELTTRYEEVCDHIRGTYPSTETGTWPVQLSEAIAYKQWVANGSIPEDKPVFILIEALSNERDLRGVGDGLEDLSTRIINNALFYNEAIAKATAIRHALEKQILLHYNNEDESKLKNIYIDFSEVIDYLKNLGV